jgi:hypothetical protein
MIELIPEGIDAVLLAARTFFDILGRAVAGLFGRGEVARGVGGDEEFGAVAIPAGEVGAAAAAFEERVEFGRERRGVAGISEPLADLVEAGRVVLVRQRLRGEEAAEEGALEVPDLAVDLAGAVVRGEPEGEQAEAGDQT